MAKKNKADTELEQENITAAESEILNNDPVYLPDPALAGWVIRSKSGKYVGWDGMWTEDSRSALRLFSERDALAYLALHYRDDSLKAIKGE